MNRAENPGVTNPAFSARPMTNGLRVRCASGAPVPHAVVVAVRLLGLRLDFDDSLRFSPYIFIYTNTVATLPPAVPGRLRLVNNSADGTVKL